MEENRNGNQMPEEQNQGPKPREVSVKTAILLVAALAVIGMMIFRFAKGDTGQKACEIVPQSPFGQSQAQIWIDLEGDLQAKGIAEFGLTYPEGPEGFDIKIYRVYTKQINSVYYQNDEGREGMRIIKGKMCGIDVFESGFYNDGNSYTFINVVDHDGKKVTLKGNQDGVQVASWVEGDFSYAVGVWNNPVSEDVMLEYVDQTE
ncbi:MAG: hypothetical protein ACI32N_10160 [Bulleidia sp.]